MSGSQTAEAASLSALNEHEMFRQEGEGLLAGLGAHGFLFHVLRCPDCRDVALARLGDWLSISQWRPPPRLIDPQARAFAAALFDDLLRLPSEERSRVIESPRFREPALFDLILESGIEAGCMQDTRTADEQAWLAVHLGTGIDADDVWLHSRMARAFCLAGSARRLAGDLVQADSAFDNAILFLSGSLERGIYCRELALLRWDQARLEAAAALLRQGAQVFGASGRWQEEAACLALLGLLSFEEGLLDSALGPLLRAQPFMAFEPSWLAARASFALAVCLAAHGKTREALGAVGAGRLFGRAAEDSEKPLHQWLEGRVEGYLGDSGEAREKLDSARRKLLAEHRWIEAGLVSLDLAALDAEAKRDRIEALMADLLEAGGEAAAGVVAQFRELTAPPKARAALLGSHLLLSARYRSLGAPPIPWVWRIAG